MGQIRFLKFFLVVGDNIQYPYDQMRPLLFSASSNAF